MCTACPVLLLLRHHLRLHLLWLAHGVKFLVLRVLMSCSKSALKVLHMTPPLCRKHSSIKSEDCTSNKWSFSTVISTADGIFDINADCASSVSIPRPQSIVGFRRTLIEVERFLPLDPCQPHYAAGCRELKAKNPSILKSGTPPRY